MNDRDAEFRAALRLSRRPGVGAKKFRALVERCGSPSAALAAVGAGTVEPLPLDDRARKKRDFDEQIDIAAAWADEPRRFVTWYGADDYPARLRDLSEPPPVLFGRGAPAAVVTPTPTVAVVGTREPAPAAVRYTEQIVRELIRLGATIISGGALGVDAAAHQAALESGGVTTAVTATGPDVDYPRSHAALFGRIAENGAVVTELWPGTSPRRDFFVTRNRIIAALADVTIVVAGGERSGARITARHATALKRPLFVPEGTAFGALPARLCNDGARVLVSAAEVIQAATRL